MIVKCENVIIPWNVTDFGSITNGEIKINVINAYVLRTVLEVTRSRISHHILKKSSVTVLTVTGSRRQYVLTHLIRSI